METTLYDVHRRARIYIAADEDKSIYLWDGHAVASIDGEDVYGWRGRHLGWFVAGVLYDGNGRGIGFTAETFKEPTFPDPGKFAKHTKSRRYPKLPPRTRPEFSQLNSGEDLEVFIRQNGP